MKNFLETFAKEGNYCCPYMFLRTIKKFRTRILALFYGVDKRTIRRWKALWKAKEYVCPCKNNVEIREQRHAAGWNHCGRGLDMPHPLDDPNIVRRCTDKSGDTGSEVTAWLQSHGLVLPGTPSTKKRPPE